MSKLIGYEQDGQISNNREVELEDIIDYDSNVDFKKCRKCKNIKNKTFFSRNKSSKDGLQSYCKECSSSYAAKWKAKNPTYLAEWYKANPDYNSVWYKNNLGYYPARYKANPDKIREISRNRYRALKNATCENAEIDPILEAERFEESERLIRDNEILIAWIYARARYLTRLTGIKHVVDHRYALENNDNCSGLHIGCNLQVITHRENIIKGSKNTDIE